jgi:chemotaxis protein methyltransferase CheR
MPLAGEELAGPWSMTAGEFQALRETARKLFGLDLKPGKEALASARLGSRAHGLGLRSIGEYLEFVKADASGAELSILIDSLTTNYTSFLREPEHFRILRESILPLYRHRREVKIWSAACSTGEEPYSILFHLAEDCGGHGLSRYSILATDISTRALAEARAGIYTAARLEGLPPEWVRKYFQRGQGQREGEFRVKEWLRARVHFARLNLMEPLGRAGVFPVIFCRNVMIYFDKPTQEDLVQRLSQCLEPGGWLLTGHAESLMGIARGFRYIAPAVYRKAGTPPGQPQAPEWKGRRG